MTSRYQTISLRYAPDSVVTKAVAMPMATPDRMRRV